MTLVMDGSFLAQTGKVRPEGVNAGALDEAHFDRRQRGITLVVGEGGPPPWLVDVAGRLRVAFAAAAAEGWRPVSQTVLVSSLQALRKVMDWNTIRPSVTPTPEGGLQFEWHDAGWDLEIEIEPNGNVETWGRHLSNGTIFDGSLPRTADNLRVALKDITLHHSAPTG